MYIKTMDVYTNSLVLIVMNENNKYNINPDNETFRRLLINELAIVDLESSLYVVEEMKNTKDRSDLSQIILYLKRLLHFCTSTTRRWCRPGDSCRCLIRRSRNKPPA